MNKIISIVFCLMFVATCSINARSQETRAGKLVIEPYTLRTFDGRQIPAELGKLTVPEDRNAAGRNSRDAKSKDPKSKESESKERMSKDFKSKEGDTKSDRLITLAFVRLKSTAAQPGSPIVWLSGGPGLAGSMFGRIPVYFQLFDKLREVSDVILLDQRGTGMSSPDLTCQPGPVPEGIFETTDKWLRGFTATTKQCAESWRSQGVNVAAYNNNADRH